MARFPLALPAIELALLYRIDTELNELARCGVLVVRFLER
jgi:hypothetical protein